MQNARIKPLILSPEQEAKIEYLKETLPKDWVKMFLQQYEDLFGVTYTRQHAYNILNKCQEEHDGWKILESIAKKHQEILAQIA